jgi:hypothetical protein
MADEHQTALSDRLRMIAHELEAQADDLARIIREVPRIAV